MSETLRAVKARFIFTFVSLATLLVVVGAFLHREPRYQGRTLTSWLQQCADTSLMETQRLDEAQDAIRAIGAKKALSKMLKLVEASDDPVSVWLMAAGEKFGISDRFGTRFIRWRSAEDFQQLGIAGFEVLGTNAAPAVGELANLLNEPDHAFTAFRCLASIGKPAEAALCQCLTNRDPHVRQLSTLELASVTDDVQTYIARIKGGLGDSSEFVRIAAVEGVGAQTAAPELAVPLLVAALKDPSDFVSSAAANALADFGTNAVSAFPMLSNLVEHGGMNAANAAIKTLVVVAPDESFSILTNCVARGRPATGGALQVLVEREPDKVLPILLAGLQSPDLNRRRVASRLLCDYPPKPEILSAMKSAAFDPDFIVSGNAKHFLTEQYRRAHPEEFQFSNEPVYQGKSLGDWLKSKRAPDGSFPIETADAIRHLGAEAIPALLARLVYVEPPVGLRTREAYEINIEAVCAFIVLGEQAKPALPRLQALMDSTNGDIALHAMLASCGTGSNAVPLLIKGLTNQFANVRSEAAHYLAEGVGAQFPEQRREAIPLIEKLLQDPNENVRVNATNELKEIDATAAANDGIK